MNEKIDSGKILLIKRYKIPKKIRSIDIDYDNEIRANNICNVIKKIDLLKKKAKNNNFFAILHNASCFEIYCL